MAVFISKFHCNIGNIKIFNIFYEFWDNQIVKIIFVPIEIRHLNSQINASIYITTLKNVKRFKFIFTT